MTVESEEEKKKRVDKLMKGEDKHESSKS
ncbi:hypothetical protein LCGC14_2491690, partial [marine sediment metagenome]